MSLIIEDSWQHSVVVVALSAHGKKVPGLKPSWDIKPFCVKFACSPCVSMDFLRFLPLPKYMQGVDSKLSLPNLCVDQLV